MSGRDVNGTGEPGRARWQRRVVTIPVCVAAALLATVGTPVVLPLLAVADLLRPLDAPGARVRGWLFVTWYLVCEVAGLIGALGVWLAALGQPERLEALSGALQRRWTDGVFFGSVWLFGIRVETTGLEHVGAGPLVLSLIHI